MFELIFGIPLDSVIKAVGNREEIYKLQEAMKGGVEIFDDGRPSSLRWVVDLNFIGEWGVSVDRSYSGYDCGEGENEKST